MRAETGLVRDQQWNARTEIMRHFAVPKPKKQKLSEAGKKGGRGKKAMRAAREALPQRNHREEQALARVKRSEPTVLELYGDGKLTQTQVDELVKLPPERQSKVAPKLVGKTRAETREVVQAERAAEAAPRKEVRDLFSALALTNSLARRFRDAMSECEFQLRRTDHPVDGSGVTTLITNLASIRRAIDDLAIQLREKEPT